MTNTLIKNHVINTCKSNEFRRILLREDAIDLEDLVNLGRSYDIADDQAKCIEGQSEVTAQSAQCSIRLILITLFLIQFFWNLKV